MTLGLMAVGTFYILLFAVILSIVHAILEHESSDGIFVVFSVMVFFAFIVFINHAYASDGDYLAGCSVAASHARRHVHRQEAVTIIYEPISDYESTLEFWNIYSYFAGWSLRDGGSTIRNCFSLN